MKDANKNVTLTLNVLWVNNLPKFVKSYKWRLQMVIYNVRWPNSNNYYNYIYLTTNISLHLTHIYIWKKKQMHYYINRILSLQLIYLKPKFSTYNNKQVYHSVHIHVAFYVSPDITVITQIIQLSLIQYCPLMNFSINALFKILCIR